MGFPAYGGVFSPSETSHSPNGDGDLCSLRSPGQLHEELMCIEFPPSGPNFPEPGLPPLENQLANVFSGELTRDGRQPLLYSHMQCANNNTKYSSEIQPLPGARKTHQPCVVGTVCDKNPL